MRWRLCCRCVKNLRSQRSLSFEQVRNEKVWNRPLSLLNYLCGRSFPSTHAWVSNDDSAYLNQTTNLKSLNLTIIFLVVKFQTTRQRQEERFCVWHFFVENSIILMKFNNLTDVRFQHCNSHWIYQQWCIHIWYHHTKCILMSNERRWQRTIGCGGVTSFNCHQTDW